MSTIRVPVSLATLALCAAFASGCSDDAVGADDFIADYPARYCAFVWRCCGSDERSFSSKTNCEQATLGELNELLAFRDAADAKASFDEKAAQACLDKLDEADCAADATLVAKGCFQDVAVPQLSSGGVCRYSAECSSYNCLQDQKGKEGVCGDRGAAGSKCSGDDRGCVTGSFCANTRLCEQERPAGASCSRSAECETGFCDAGSKLCGNKVEPFCDG